MRTQKHCGRCGQRLDIEYEVDAPSALIVRSAKRT